MATNRGLLLNWSRQFLYWITIVVISFFIYQKFIKVKANILPDFTTLANELWIIILIFIFQIANNLRFSQEETYKRKDNYLKNRYLHFKRNYGQLIKDLTNNEMLESIVYAVIIYEDFNRPKIARWIENLKFTVTKKPHTLGVMQVRSDRLLSDFESVQLGSEKIVEAYKKYIEKLVEKNESFSECAAIHSIIEDYNTGSSYNSEVSELADIIKNTFYKDTAYSLNLELKNDR